VTSASVARYRALMIGHGALVLTVGLLVGFVFAFNLIEEISLWPFGTLEVRIPGDPARWRAFHLGAITNGLMILGIGLSLGFLELSKRAQAFVCWGMVLAVWGNTGFFLLSALGAPGRGLTMGVNKFGGGDLLSQLSFLVAYPGAFVTPVVLLVVARAAFVVARQETGADV
jgi:hypothetical protein